MNAKGWSEFRKQCLAEAVSLLRKASCEHGSLPRCMETGEVIEVQVFDECEKISLTITLKQHKDWEKEFKLIDRVWTKLGDD